MEYMSVKETAEKFNISERRVQKLCELQRISGAEMISGVWVIPNTAQKPTDERLTMVTTSNNYVTLNDLCESLSISTATGRNWVKLGKLTPEYVEKRTPVFTVEYVNNLKKGIQTGKNKVLKSRRNKKYVSGNALYNSYVSEDCNGVIELQKLLTLIDENKIELTESIIHYFVADCAIHLFADKLDLPFKGNKLLLEKLLLGEISIGKFDELLVALIDDKEQALAFCKENQIFFNLEYGYEPNEDVLGLIYISCKNMGNRKATGSYYTSTKVVKRLIAHLGVSLSDKILDPCCGTGNFLLQLPDEMTLENIYGNDIDSTSVKITRINLALKFPEEELKTIYEHVTENDYLLTTTNNKYNYIIGNPPWGYDFSDIMSIVLREKYKSAVGKNIESYDVFVEQALHDLDKGGCLAFVLPEAILNVKAHMPIRRILMEKSSIKVLDFLGNAFDGVQCPCIILDVKKTEDSFSTVGMKVNDGKKEFIINTDRKITSEYFSFTTTDEEYEIIEKVTSLENVKYLLGNADFALGIVTGNNKEYISDTKTDNNEMVLKGADICKYHINPTNNYIVFKPESFQQIAPTEMYRAEEKLLYRFICNQLVFAYDDKQTLSLNSCNIVIPKIEGIKIKYILAILNSRVAQFIYKKQFNSVKVLRSHIENIPIPFVSERKQDEIIAMTEKLIDGCDLEEATAKYELLDDKVSELYGLDNTEKGVISEAVDGENKFLV